MANHPNRSRAATLRLFESFVESAEKLRASSVRIATEEAKGAAGAATWDTHERTRVAYAHALGAMRKKLGKASS